MALRTRKVPGAFEKAAAAACPSIKSRALALSGVGRERESARQLSYVYGIIFLAPVVVQRLDNAIHLINRYPADKCYKTNHAIHWIANYPVDSVIHFSNNRGQYFSITTVTNCYISICAL